MSNPPAGTGKPGAAAALAAQIEQYDTISFAKTYRGQAAIMLYAVAVLYFFLILDGSIPTNGLFG